MPSQTGASSAHSISDPRLLLIKPRTVDPRMLLTDFFTHNIRMASCHVGCEHGVWGMHATH